MKDYCNIMMHGRSKIFGVLGSLALCGSLQVCSAAGESPYGGIVGSNIFKLKPPPPPTSSTEQEKAPPPNITLTGITTIFGNKRAIMRTPPVAAKPGEPARDQSFFLAEGQQDGEMEVVEIDEKTGTVKVKYGGTPLTLTFDKNGSKTASAGPPGAGGAIPGMPMQGGGGVRPALVNPFNPPADTGGINKMPPRTLRVPNQGSTSGGSGASYSSASAGGYSAGGGYGAMPNNTLGNAGSVAGLPGAAVVPGAAGNTMLDLTALTQPTSSQAVQPNWPPEVPMTAQEQEVIHQVQLDLHKDDPNFPGFPGMGTPTQPADPTQGNPASAGNPTLPNQQGIPNFPNLPNRLPLPPGPFGRGY